MRAFFRRLARILTRCILLLSSSPGCRGARRAGDAVQGTGALTSRSHVFCQHALQPIDGVAHPVPKLPDSAPPAPAQKLRSKNDFQHRSPGRNASVAHRLEWTAESVARCVRRAKRLPDWFCLKAGPKQQFAFATGKKPMPSHKSPLTPASLSHTSLDLYPLARGRFGSRALPNRPGLELVS